jgi:hypothetical protein
MASLQISTLAFDMPPDTASYQLVPQDLSFSFQQSGNIRTLNSGYSPPASTGILYVPILDGACSHHVPENVTRYSSLPLNFQRIAIAPWISPACTLRYLNAAPSDSISAFVFFLPDAANAPLPSAQDAAWSLGDGGHWKSVTGFPVYAIPSQVGQTTLDQMALYSGNLSDVPNAQRLTDLGYPYNVYFRLSMAIDSGNNGSNLPSIWVFLLIILAVLLVFIGVLSLVMHMLQRKRRNDLRARIAQGEVDIEALGLGKLTVPREMIDKMPLYAYTPRPDAVLAGKGLLQAPPPLQQSTCAICLDDFADSASRIRELPCRHVFHAECIDLFLLDNSSVCPLCKQSVLPPGYVPGKITNSMVRKERYLRRNAARRARHAAQPHNASLGNIMLFGRRAPAAASNPSHRQGVEMTDQSAWTTVQQRAPRTSQGRREWARRRALAMSGATSSSDEEEAEQTRSKMRKLLRTIFPNL